MTVESTDRKVALATNGSVKTFPFDFKVLDEDHIEVYLDDTEVTTGFTITINEAGTSGSVVFTTAPATGQTLTILRVVPVDRQVDYAPNADLRSATLNNDLDKGIMISQQLADDIRKCVKFGFSSTKVDCVIDDPVTDRMLAWDSSGNLINVINPLPGTAAYVVQAASYASSASASASSSAASASQSASYSASSASSAGAAAAAVSNAISLNRNKIQNGAFRWWQRGVTFDGASSEYTADRFRSNIYTACDRSDDVPANQGFDWSAEWDAGDTNNLIFYHAIELPDGLPGEFYVGSKWTFSGWMKCDKAKTVGCNFQFRDNTDATDTTNLVQAGGSTASMVTLAADTWTYFTYSLTVTGTVDTTNNKALVIMPYITTTGEPGSGATLKTTGLQFEKGEDATPFEFIPRGIELAIMQRYYEVHYPGTTDMAHKRYASATGAGWAVGGGTFLTQKRVPPEVTITGSFTYTRCSTLSILATTTGYNASVTITGTGIYQVVLSGLIYLIKFDAEI